MHDILSATPEEARCSIEAGDCGSWVAIPFFVSYVVGATFIVLKMIVALIVENYLTAQVAYYSLLTTHYLLCTTYYLLRTTYYLLLTTYYSLLSTYYSPSRTTRLPRKAQGPPPSDRPTVRSYDRPSVHPPTLPSVRPSVRPSVCVRERASVRACVSILLLLWRIGKPSL